MNNNDICGVLSGGSLGGRGGVSSVPVCTAIFNPFPLSSPINHTVSVDVRKSGAEARGYHRTQESRRTSWAAVPNKPTVSVDVKQHFDNNNNNRGYHSLHTLQHNTGR